MECDCGRSFVDRPSLRQHQLALHGCQCPHCDRKLVSPAALEDHNRALHSFRCNGCDQAYRNRHILNRHQKSNGHCYCPACDIHFDTPSALRQHETAPGHIGEFHCCDCDRDFVNEQALQQHLRDKVHKPKPVTKKRVLCDQCEREFTSEDALSQHKKSLVHRPLSNLECIDSRCQQRFKSPSSLLHHLESGSCRSGMTRGKLNEILYAHDTDRIITGQAQHQIDWDDTLSVSSGSSAQSQIIYTPSSTASASSLCLVQIRLPEVQDFETVKAGRIPCTECSRTFKTRQALIQHRESAAHSSAIFNCPTSLLGRGSGPKQSFSTISGLAQHLEAGACVGGYSMLQEAARYLEGCLHGMGLKRKILLNGTK